MAFRALTDADSACDVVDVVASRPLILMELNGSGGIEKTYIHANGRIIAQHAGDHTADRYFYLHDRLGSVRLLIDTSAGVKNRYIYRPFGELHTYTADYEETITNPFKFTGQYFDADIDQYYLRARQYDPHLARFTSRDPVSGQFEDPLTLHVYLYCQNDPLNKIDPFGRDYIDINVTWTYGMVAGMLRGAAFFGGSSLNPLGIAIGAGVGMAAGGLGVTGGVMLEHNEAHLYLGISWRTNLAGGADFTFSFCPDPYTTVERGFYWGVSGATSGVYSQYGEHIGSGAPFWEVGLTTGTSLGWGAGASLFYAFSGIEIPGPDFAAGGDPRSAFSDLDLLDRAIMMNEMREDTAALISSDRFGAMGDIGFISYYGVMSYLLLDM